MAIGTRTKTTGARCRGNEKPDPCQARAHGCAAGRITASSRAMQTSTRAPWARMPVAAPLVSLAVSAVPGESVGPEQDLGDRTGEHDHQPWPGRRGPSPLAARRAGSSPGGSPPWRQLLRRARRAPERSRGHVKPPIADRAVEDIVVAEEAERRSGFQARSRCPRVCRSARSRRRSSRRSGPTWRSPPPGRG